jgi:hypothetical protein
LNGNNSDLSVYDVLLYWDHKNDNSIQYKQYCSETICNVLGYPASLAVKIMYEAIDNSYGLLFVTELKDKAVAVRDNLISCGLDCRIRPIHIDSISK